VIHRVEPWTVLRFSILFYSSMLLVWLVAGVLLWAAAAATGIVDNLERFVEDLFALESFRVNSGLLLTSCVIGGLIVVLLATGANVLMAVIYNLTSDIVGGVEVTVREREPSRRPVV
jgi:hypothetical protein